jgi:hypothetical protein
LQSAVDLGHPQLDRVAFLHAISLHALHTNDMPRLAILSHWAADGRLPVKSRARTGNNKNRILTDPRNDALDANSLVMGAGFRGNKTTQRL